MCARTWQVRWATMGLVMALAGGCGSPNDNSASIRAKQSGMSMPKNSGQIPDAISPDILPETHLAAGRLHESEGRWVRAVEQYRMAVTVNPKSIEAYNRLGVVLDRLGKFREADAVFSRAIQIAPNEAHIRNNLAFSYIMQGRWADAQAELTKAIEINPNFVRARVNMGTVLAQQGNFEEGFKNFYQVLRPEDAYYNIGLMYQSKQRTVEAAQAFQQALAVNPKMAAAQKRLELLPPTAVAEAEQRGAMFAFMVALTGQTGQNPPATQPAEPEAADATATIESPAPSTQPASIEIAASDLPPLPMDETEQLPNPATQPDPECGDDPLPIDPLVPAEEAEDYGVAEASSEDEMPLDDTEMAVAEATPAETESVTDTESESTEIAGADDQPVARTQPAGSEIASAIETPAPATQPASMDMADIDIEPAQIIEPEPMDMAITEHPPAPTTEPDPEPEPESGSIIAAVEDIAADDAEIPGFMDISDIAEAWDRALMDEMDSTDLVADEPVDPPLPPARTGLLAMLAQPAELISWGIEPIETMMSWISPATIDSTEAVASPTPVEITEPQAEEPAFEEVPVSAEPSNQP